MKTGLDDAGSALMARVRSGSRSPKYGSKNGSFIDKPVWDKHHANCTHQDNTKLLNQEVHARMLQNVKLKDDRDKLKKKIIDLRQELLKVKEKFWRKQQVEELREKVKKYEQLIQQQNFKHTNINFEVAALKEENT